MATQQQLFYYFRLYMYICCWWLVAVVLEVIVIVVVVCTSNKINCSAVQPAKRFSFFLATRVQLTTDKKLGNTARNC